ncbi:hypothetical protein CPLU01_15218 [Colletotrichum plurivorum]|uniref:Lipocalin-like domain-containing protein n=1 Tax=Colletotrichum plurivorum TaxID=2175906 RepID=A0A8H6MWK1_9PEZI|nr:hypothetical protein CPLU01_15218 [Colletotrichum plurivorum]
MKCERALQCFIGGWGYLNATLENTNTGELIPEWHSIYPSGGSVYAASGQISFIITANDTTQAEFRPKDVSLPAKPTDSNNTWALVAQHSLGVYGNFRLSNLNCSGEDGNKDKKGDKGKRGQDKKEDGKDQKKKDGKDNKDCDLGGKGKGPSGLLTVDVTSATLPSYVGLTLPNTFGFTDDCSKHFLRADFGGGLVQTVWFHRLPQQDIFA